MHDYYQKHLSARRLELVYELAPSRVRQYLEAEISFVLERVRSSDIVLELGCGYGRVLSRLMRKAKTVVGIDSSGDTLKFVPTHLQPGGNLLLAQMDAVSLGFGSEIFDLVICIQNGISAFHVNPIELLRESLRVTKKGGLILFSSYAEKFWPDRLDWFRIQSEHGLVGEIDWAATRDGKIVCKDGFTASTFGVEEFNSLVSRLGLDCRIYDVDNSSIFCEIRLISS